MSGDNGLPRVVVAMPFQLSRMPANGRSGCCQTPSYVGRDALNAVELGRPGPIRPGGLRGSPEHNARRGRREARAC
jgi:hypothetical protein